MEMSMRESLLQEKDENVIYRNRSFTPDVSKLKDWEFAGWGKHHKLQLEPEKLTKYKTTKGHTKLGEWAATAICGNDILSSCLYVSGMTAVYAGYLAPVALLLVTVVLSCYRRIYGEVVTALPKNGGVFNALIHTTSKGNAAFASCLSLLSYVATGVVSATTAIHYLKALLECVYGEPSMLPVVPATVALLFAFAVLCFMGLKESSVIALCIFFVHSLCLSMLIIFCALYGLNEGWKTLSENYSMDLPVVILNGTPNQSFFASLFMGFSTAMLGVSGFESSSQFVEEQMPGVFRKTLTNMLFAVAFFNPTISLLSFATLPYNSGDVNILNTKYTLLSEMALVSAGPWFELIISIDAFVVLCGAVLTGYVGVNGLIRRIASDRCLPQFLLQENSWRKSNHYIIFGFFAISSSLLIVLKGDESVLAGVYTYAFLGVMLLLGVACVILNVKRPDIPREEKAPSYAVALGVIGVSTGLLGNVIGKPGVLENFVLYFTGIALVMCGMYFRIQILKLMVRLVHTFLPCFSTSKLTAMIESINGQTIVFFTKKADLAVMTKAVIYVRNNEQTHNMTFIHVVDSSEIDSSSTMIESGGVVDTTDSVETGVTSRITHEILSERVGLLDKMFPKIKLDSLTIYGGEFESGVIQYVSDVLDIPENFMFMASSDKHDMSVMGGLRVITHSA